MLHILNKLRPSPAAPAAGRPAASASSLPPRAERRGGSCRNEVFASWQTRVATDGGKKKPSPQRGRRLARHNFGNGDGVRNRRASVNRLTRFPFSIHGKGLETAANFGALSSTCPTTGLSR